MSKWTAGEWYVDVHEDYTNVESQYESIAVDVSNSNAHLISAAPDLYDALWTAVEHNALHFGENHNTVIAGRAALRKARGE